MKKIFNYGLAVAAGIIPTIAYPLLAKAQTTSQFNEWGFGSGMFRFTSLEAAVRSLVNILLLAAGMVAVIYLIIGGYQYVTASGNAEQAAAARTTILNALIGLLVIFASFAIVNFVVTRFLQGA